MTQASFRSLIGFPSPVIPSSGRFGKFLRAPLPLSIYSLLSGLLLDFHQQVYDHAGHTSRRRSRLNRGADRHRGPHKQTQFGCEAHGDRSSSLFMRGAHEQGAGRSQHRVHAAQRREPSKSPALPVHFDCWNERKGHYNLFNSNFARTYSVNRFSPVFKHFLKNSFALVSSF